MEKKILEEFALIDEWGVIKEDNNQRMVAIEVKLSDWFYNSILGNAVLSIDKDYFRLENQRNVGCMNWHGSIVAIS